MYIACVVTDSEGRQRVNPAGLPEGGRAADGAPTPAHCAILRCLYRWRATGHGVWIHEARRPQPLSSVRRPPCHDCLRITTSISTTAKLSISAERLMCVKMFFILITESNGWKGADVPHKQWRGLFLTATILLVLGKVGNGKTQM